VEIDKGVEYERQQLLHVLGPGQAALRLSVRRWADLRENRWHAGDMRAHYLSPHEALLEGAAEGLEVIDLLARKIQDTQTGSQSFIENILAFSGQQPALQGYGSVVVVNTRNYHPVLGSLALLNCHRPVFPLAFGGESGREDWTLADWCDQCHRKNGLVVWADDKHQTKELVYGEQLADLILGKIDAFELCAATGSYSHRLEEWYSLLNAGLKVPIVGSSGKIDSSIALGELRTYSQLMDGEDLTYGKWIEAVRSGRTFVTNGPLLLFSVSGNVPGSALELSPSGPSLRIRAEARSQAPFETLQLLSDGKIIVECPATGSPSCATIEMDWTPDRSTWLAARCSSGNSASSSFAHTSPVYISADTRGRSDRRAAARLVHHLDQGLRWLDAHGRFDNEAQKENLASAFRAARQRLTGN
jgi:hypothetical protein